MNGDSVIARRDGWLAASIDQDLVMMHPKGSFYLNLSGTGGRIWELLERPLTIMELCQALCRDYAVQPDVAYSEVVTFLTKLLQHKAIDVRSPELA